MTENERFTENGKTINGCKMEKSFEKCLNDNKKTLRNDLEITETTMTVKMTEHKMNAICLKATNPFDPQRNWNAKVEK